MVLKTKYDVGDEVWFISNNKVKCSVIKMLRMRVYKNEFGVMIDELNYTVECLEPGTDVNLSEDKLFYSKEELLNTL